MKKRVYFFLLVLFTWQNNSSAQTSHYFPFPDSNAVWKTNWYEYGDGCLVEPCWYLQYQIVNDTILNGKQYQIISKAYIGFNESCSCYNNIGVERNYLYMRNDTITRKVFYYNFPDSDGILYDFSLKPGDYLPNNSDISQTIDSIKVTTIDSILINNSYRKSFNLNVTFTQGGTDTVSIIEGIGSTGGLLEEIPPYYVFQEEVGKILNCVQVDSQIIYNAFNSSSCEVSTGIMKTPPKVNLKIFPNPVEMGGNISIQGILENYSLTISNVLGQIVFSTPMNNSQSIALPGSIISGVYICRILTQDNLLMTKKIVVL
jgi:hypothetical protein